jgi:hypothetical protein
VFEIVWEWAEGKLNRKDVTNEFLLANYIKRSLTMLLSHFRKPGSGLRDTKTRRDKFFLAKDYHD